MFVSNGKKAKTGEKDLNEDNFGICLVFLKKGLVALYDVSVIWAKIHQLTINDKHNHNIFFVVY